MPGTADLVAEPALATESDHDRRAEIDALLTRAHSLPLWESQTAVELCEQALALAERGEHLEDRARALLEAGDRLHTLGEMAASRSRLDAAQAIFGVLGDGFGLAESRNILGIIALDQGEFDLATSQLTAAIAGFRAACRSDLEAAALYNLGKVFLRLGDGATALDYFLQCAAIEETIAEPIDRALTLTSIAAVCRELERFDAALDYAERGLALVEQADGRLRSTVLIDVGVALADLGRWDDAFSYLREAVTVAEATGNPARIRDAVVNLAETLIRNGRCAEAGVHAERARLISARLGERYAEARALLLIWDAAAATAPGPALGDLDASPLVRALAFADDAGALRLQRDAHERLAQASEVRGDYSAAAGHLRAVIDLERRLFDDQSDRRARSLTIRYETERARAEAEIERLRGVELAAANAELQRAHERTAALLAQVQEQAALLRRQATEDALTGLANRRSLDQELARELDRAARFGRPLAVAMIDIDWFKTINDRFSHQTGDRGLQTVGRILRQGLREVDLIARYGGEEFSLVFPETEIEQAIAAVERLRRGVEAESWTDLVPGLAVTISAGVTAAAAGDAPDDVLRRADQLLYEAKRGGRNRVVSREIANIVA